jgi:hypothetical protein
VNHPLNNVGYQRLREMIEMTLRTVNKYLGLRIQEIENKPAELYVELINENTGDKLVMTLEDFTDRFNAQTMSDELFSISHFYTKRG